MILAPSIGTLSLRANDLIGTVGLLLDSALKGTLLVGAAALAAYLLRNRSAAARHAAWTAAVIGHLALPAITLLAPAWRLPFLPPPPWLTSSALVVQQPLSAATGEKSITTSTTPTDAGVPNGAKNPGSTAAPVATTQVASNTSNANAPVPAVKSSFAFPTGLPLLAALWIVGSLIVLLRLVLGTVKVGQLARQGSRVMDGAWLALAQRIAARMSINRPLTLLHGDRLGIPVTWGIVYPAVLLPPDADEWPESRRRFVLVHEMAHVKRFDALTQLAAQFAVAIFWFDPLIWLAAHRMHVEREHACDDYVLRDGTTPSLYAGELLEMVRSLGTPEHERAAPAFAALAMARRSEFEGRMLAILDPKLDRHTLDRRSTLFTSAFVALLVLPLAALRPFHQPTSSPTPQSVASQVFRAAPATRSSAANSTCDSADVSASGSISTHISLHDDPDKGTRALSLKMSRPGRCAEASITGLAKLSRDETRVVDLPVGAVASFREVEPNTDRSVVLVSTGRDSLNYTAHVNGRLVPFDAPMRTWLARLLPEVMRESSVDADKRVARLRRDGGVPAVIAEIALIRSPAAKAAHYEALLDMDSFTQDDIDQIARAAAQDLASSPPDFKSVMDMMEANRPASKKGATGPSASARAAVSQSVEAAVKKATSSGDKAAILSQYATNDDPESMLLVLRGAKQLTSDGDKAAVLKLVVAKSLSARNATLRTAFFDAVNTLTSDGDTRDVLVAAVPYAHTDAAVAIGIASTVSHINSPGDKATVLIAMAEQRLLTTKAIREEFFRAASKIASPSDYRRVLESAVQK